MKQGDIVHHKSNPKIGMVVKHIAKTPVTERTIVVCRWFKGSSMVQDEFDSFELLENDV